MESTATELEVVRPETTVHVLKEKREVQCKLCRLPSSLQEQIRSLRLNDNLSNTQIALWLRDELPRRGVQTIISALGAREGVGPDPARCSESLPGAPFFAHVLYCSTFG